MNGWSSAIADSHWVANLRLQGGAWPTFRRCTSWLEAVPYSFNTNDGAVDAFGDAVLPRLARIDQSHVETLVERPSEQGCEKIVEMVRVISRYLTRCGGQRALCCYTVLPPTENLNGRTVYDLMELIFYVIRLSAHLQGAWGRPPHSPRLFRTSRQPSKEKHQNDGHNVTAFDLAEKGR